MSVRIVIIGAGTGGTLIDNHLHRVHGADAGEIVVIDRDDRHVYQPGLLFVPFGLEKTGGHRPFAPGPAARRDRLPPG